MKTRRAALSTASRFRSTISVRRNLGPIARLNTVGIHMSTVFWSGPQATQALRAADGQILEAWHSLEQVEPEVARWVEWYNLADRAGPVPTKGCPRVPGRRGSVSPTSRGSPDLGGLPVGVGGQVQPPVLRHLSNERGSDEENWLRAEHELASSGRSSI